MQLEEREQESGPNSSMAERLELSGWDFKTTVSNMLRAVTEKKEKEKKKDSM